MHALPSWPPGDEGLGSPDRGCLLSPTKSMTHGRGREKGNLRFDGDSLYGCVMLRERPVKTCTIARHATRSKHRVCPPGCFRTSFAPGRCFCYGTQGLGHLKRGELRRMRDIPRKGGCLSLRWSPYYDRLACLENYNQPCVLGLKYSLHPHGNSQVEMSKERVWSEYRIGANVERSRY